MIEFDAIFEGALVPEWLEHFQDEPLAALEDLLVGRADLGMLSADEPTSVLLDWLEGLGAQSGFPARVDETLAQWIDRAWGQPVLDLAGSATMTAVAWCRAADVIAMDERLDRSAGRLRGHVLRNRVFLHALVEGRARDPQGRAWLALARHQPDRSLLDDWWRLCRLPPEEPWYRGAYGIEGLRGLPSSGGFSSEVAEGLAILASGLMRRCKDGFLAENVAQDEFLRTARLTMAAYPFPEHWQSFWQNAMERRGTKPPAAWVADFVAAQRETRPAKTRQPSPTVWARPDPQWATKAGDLAGRLRRAESSALPEAEALVNSQANYAEATGDTYYVVRTACNLAKAVWEHKPEVALGWANRARRFDPWNAYTWTTAVRASLLLRDTGSAVALGVEAVARFPSNVVARTGLAEVLKAQDRLDEAESLYRETSERFPDNVVARTGLAEVLKAQDRLDEAEALYRETRERFPDNVVACNGLAELLKAQDRLDEAENVYREALRLSPGDAYARTGLKSVLVALGKWTEEAAREFQVKQVEWPELRARPAKGQGPKAAEIAPSVAESRGPFQGPREEAAAGGVESQAAAGLREEDAKIVLGDAYVLRRWGRRAALASGVPTGKLRDQAAAILRPLVGLSERNPQAASESGLLYLEQGDLEQAVTLLREASERFRGSVRVRYALARAERELAERERQTLMPETERKVIEPWRQLFRLDQRCRPVCMLGEGRAWLALTDGEQVEGHARDCFGKLARWVHERLGAEEERGRGRGDSGDSEGEEDVNVFGWWAQNIQRHLFASESVSSAKDLGDLAPIRGRVHEHADLLNRLEEELVYCVAQV